jgi:hypothetical protein
MKSSLYRLFLESWTNETLLGERLQLLLVDDFGWFRRRLGDVDMKIDIADSVRIQFDRGVHIDVFALEFASPCEIAMLQRPGIGNHLGDSIILGFNVEVETVIAALAKVPPYQNFLLIKRDDLSLSKVYSLAFGFDVFKAEDPVFP